MRLFPEILASFYFSLLLNQTMKPDKNDIKSIGYNYLYIGIGSVSALGATFALSAVELSFPVKSAVFGSDRRNLSAFIFAFIFFSEKVEFLERSNGKLKIIRLIPKRKKNSRFSKKPANFLPPRSNPPICFA